MRQSFENWSVKRCEYGFVESSRTVSFTKVIDRAMIAWLLKKNMLVGVIYVSCTIPFRVFFDQAGFGKLVCL